MKSFKELRQLTSEQAELDEAVKLNSKVKIHAPGKDYHGKVGHVGEIRKGLHDKAPKTYTVDYDYDTKTGNKKSIQLDKSQLKMHKEDAEQIDELKRTTLANYVSKAAGSYGRDKQVIGRESPDGTMAKARPELKLAVKNRLTGINRAAERLAKEEAELDEAIKKPNATTRHLRQYPVSDKDMAKPVKQSEYQHHVVSKLDGNVLASYKSKEAAHRNAHGNPVVSGSLETIGDRKYVREQGESKPITYYSLVHKATNKVLSTHKDLESAKDEHRGMDQGERAHYRIATSTKAPKSFSMKEGAAEGLNEMDKSAPQPGRDGGHQFGPGPKVSKKVTKAVNKDPAKHLSDLFAKEYDKKKQGVAEGWMDDPSPGAKHSIKQDKIRSLKNLISSHEEKAIAANRAGDDAKTKQHQQRVQQYKQALGKLVKEGVAEENILEGAYEKSEENKRSADAAKKQGDMFAHHLHMADHHDNLAQWHAERGRHSVADSHAAKAEEHQEKAMEHKKQGVAEAAPFSYGYKKPRKGSVAYWAEKKRKEQEKGKPPIEPKDQMVGVAKVTKGVAEGSLETDNMVSHIGQVIQSIYPRGGDKNTYMKLVAQEMPRIVKANPKLFRRAFGMAYDRFFHIDQDDDFDYTDYSMRQGERGMEEGVAGPKQCWPGHRKVGTKPGTGKNAGKRVNDCEKIKKEDTYMESLWDQLNTVVNEKAPPGDKYERMVKHIKKGYAKDGKISDKERSIAYATAWKAKNKAKK